MKELLCGEVIWMSENRIDDPALVSGDKHQKADNLNSALNSVHSPRESGSGFFA